MLLKLFQLHKMAEKATKLKQRKRKEKQGNEHEGDEKCYLRWNIQMDRSLAEILREERQMGHKGDGGWKSVAYNTAAAILSAQYNIEVSADNIKNRVKTWKRFYAVVSDILSQSGFSWDATKKMITIDEENVWNEYVKSHEDARTFRYKVIANWDDIVDLCGKDRATGEGAETCFEAAEVMTPDSEPNNFVDLGADTQGFENSHIDDVSPNSSCPKKRNQPSSEIRPPKKRGTPNVLADSVAKMASSFEQFINATTQKLDPLEVYNEVNAIPELNPDEQLKACTWFIENEKQFLMLKTLPVERKKGMVLMFISPRA
ncbi:hypothetical protein PRUPE_1G245200 [Prunus persica]|uniref:Myb/SANT-like domain-containing protein n=1 Tax=Prunus persica TaxID=3760 RepID=A0A251R2W5_PRUPE|nr:hypothetical protein PRUPE_1G245200 [Prunus persica]